jgi:molecular chaperone HtpG
MRTVMSQNPDTPDTPDTPATEGAQTLGFQAEVKQLLQLMIHSLYSNRDIFLRELVSNASDACDRLRFAALAEPALMAAGEELSVSVEADPEARTITISDNGIGLSREEMIDHLGTIARSGTREFFSRLTGDQQRDAQLIGQFGVGFYSAFIVADRVSVVSRRAGAQGAQRWESDGEGAFTIAPAERAARGTDVILHLKADADELLSNWKLRAILTRYSDHIATPIRMPAETWDAETKGPLRTGEMETVNQASALWTRARSDITEEQYQDFYRHLSHDHEAPLAWTHNRVEGRNEYVQLLYLPRRAPFDMWDRQASHGLKLYVRRVFIMDEAEQLLPGYLRFVRGVVDSSDLPLNVSREILQESRDVKAIREGCTRRVLGLLEELARDRPDDYALFWQTFGPVLKEGLGEDPGNAARLAPLLRFETTAEGETRSSLAQVKARMKQGQAAIYYVTGESAQAARSSPQLEVFRKKGIEVLLLTDRVDEWMLSFLTEFEGTPLASVARGDLDLSGLADEAEKQAAEQVEGEVKGLVESVRRVLGARVSEVRVSRRLTDSPACVVVAANAMSSHLQRMLRASGQKAEATAPILELNPVHPLVRALQGADDARLTEWSALLLDQAILAEGGQLEDPAGFVHRINRLLASATGA